MPINYIYKVEEDKHIIEASEEIDVILEYDNTKVIEKTLEIDTCFILPLSVDGLYTVTIRSLTETETFTIDYILKLQLSLIKDIYLTLCDNCKCKGCKNTNKCIKKHAKTLLKVENIFNKVYVYHLYYFPKYNETQLVQTTNYLSAAFSSYKCNLQDLINRITLNECIEGSSTFNIKMFKIHLYLFWTAMYFTEKYINNVELEFLNKKFFFKEINNCTCDICFDFEALEELYNESVPTEIEIYSFQFDNFIDDITSVNNITESFLENSAVLRTEEEMLQGINIDYTNTGRYGFVVRTDNIDLYRIYDVNDNEITDIVFDRYVDTARNLLFIVSKNSAIGAIGNEVTLYTKFLNT